MFGKIGLGAVVISAGFLGSAGATTYCEPSSGASGTTAHISGHQSAPITTDTQSHDYYSNDWRNETQITGTPSVITGSWNAWNDYDLIYLTGLDAGAQTLTLTFSVPTGVSPNWAYAAGGAVMYSTSPYQWSAWEGTLLGYVGLSYWDLRPDTLTLTLGDSFQGSLHLGLYGSYGVLDYTITGMRYAAAPISAAPLATPAVPLPAPVIMLGAGIALLGVMGARGRRVS